MPQAVEAQTKSPIAIDIDSSPQAPAAKREETIKAEVSAADALGSSNVITIDDDAPHPITADVNETVTIKPEYTDTTSSIAAPAINGEALAKTDPDTLAGDALGLSSSDLNFTDIQFSLAPDNGADTQEGGGDANDTSFDLTTFGTGDADTGSLDMLATNLGNDRPAVTEPAGTDAAPTTGEVETKTEEGSQKTKPAEMTGDAPGFDGMFSGDGQADGMDFDFSLGDVGMGDDTFDDLMNDRDNTFDTMEHGDFDASFFGLDKMEEVS